MFFYNELDLIYRYITPGTESKTEKISVLSRAAESKKNFTDCRHTCDQYQSLIFQNIKA